MLGKEFRLKRSFFVWASTAVTALVLVSLALYYSLGDAMSSPILSARLERLFSDFSEVLGFSVSSNPYEQHGTSYPPLAILLFKPLGLLCSAASKNSHADFLASPTYLALYALYFVSTVVLACAVFKRFFKKLGDKSALLCASALFVFGGGTVYAFLRGNIIITALLFTLVFLAFKDSENKLLREVALLSLALAGAIKIYPLIFGAFLLNKKRFFDSARVALYFAILFILPFLAFDGGLDNIGLFFKNMSTFQYGQSRLYERSNMSVAGLIVKVFSLFKQTSAVVTLTDVLSKLCTVLAFALCAFVAVFTANDTRRAIACAAAICVVPSVSYFYATVFMVVPLVYYFCAPCVENDEQRATLKAFLRGGASLDQIKDVVFWCSVGMISMAVQVPLRFAMGSALYIVVLILGMSFLEARALCNKRILKH